VTLNREVSARTAHVLAKWNGEYSGETIETIRQCLAMCAPPERRARYDLGGPAQDRPYPLQPLQKSTRITDSRVISEKTNEASRQRWSSALALFSRILGSDRQIIFAVHSRAWVSAGSRICRARNQALWQASHPLSQGLVRPIRSYGLLRPCSRPWVTGSMWTLKDQLRISRWQPMPRPL
jgi:hypothetical protein